MDTVTPPKCLTSVSGSFFRSAAGAMFLGASPALISSVGTRTVYRRTRVSGPSCGRTPGTAYRRRALGGNGRGVRAIRGRVGKVGEGDLGALQRLNLLVGHDHLVIRQRE